MTDELDMIPAIMYVSYATDHEYDQRKQPHLVQLEHVDTGVMNVNVFGPKWDYQIQVKIKDFLALMKAENMLCDSE